MLLKTIAISKAFHKSQDKVLRDVNINIPSNSITAFIGKSGGGKSTLCRIIMGLEKASSGEVQLAGQRLKNIKKRSFEHCSSIQYIFQDPYAALEPRYTVARTLEEPTTLCKRHHRKSLNPEAALDLASLPRQLLNHRVATLSGGQRQKLAIARALIPQPRLIIADECTSMLDRQSTDSINTIFTRLRDETGLSFLLVTHSAAIITSICDRICLLHDGSAFEYASRIDFYHAPAGSYARDYIQSIEEIEGGTCFEQGDPC